MTLAQDRARKANKHVFPKGRKKRREHKTVDERQAAIDEWLKDHQVKVYPPGWSNYGWQS